MVDVPHAAKRHEKFFRVLLVDDEQLIRKLLARALSGPELEVLEAPSGTAALELFAAERFDLVITDVQMPEMTGIELTRRLKQQVPTLPVVLISGVFELAPHERPEDVGAVAVLCKPFLAEELQAIALRALKPSEPPLEPNAANVPR